MVFETRKDAGREEEEYRDNYESGDQGYRAEPTDSAVGVALTRRSDDDRLDEWSALVSHVGERENRRELEIHR